MQKSTTTEMTPEARAAKNRYRRKWAKEHPDKVKAQQVRYWTKQAEMSEDDTTGKETPSHDTSATT